MNSLCTSFSMLLMCERCLQIFNYTQILGWNTFYLAAVALVVLAILGMLCLSKVLFCCDVGLRVKGSGVLPTKFDFGAWNVSKNFEIPGFSLHLMMALSNI